MHITILSLIVAIAVCVLLLVAFGLFTMTPLARQITEDARRRNQDATDRVRRSRRNGDPRPNY
jgi:hypothetical protein